MKPIITDIPAPPGDASFVFKIGETYETQSGNFVKVMGRTSFAGYESLLCSDRKHRYDRSTDSADAGRVTGTAHDYSDGANFVRPPRVCQHLHTAPKGKWTVCRQCGKILE